MFNIHWSPLFTGNRCPHCSSCVAVHITASLVPDRVASRLQSLRHHSQHGSQAWDGWCSSSNSETCLVWPGEATIPDSAHPGCQYRTSAADWATILASVRSLTCWRRLAQQTSSSVGSRSGVRGDATGRGEVGRCELCCRARRQGYHRLRQWGSGRLKPREDRASGQLTSNPNSTVP